METKGKGLKLIYIYVCIYKSEQVLYKQSKTKILPPPPAYIQLVMHIMVKCNYKSYNFKINIVKMHGT